LSDQTDLGSDEVAPRPLYVFNAGLLRGRVRRILELSGWAPRLGLPGRSDAVGIWGAAGTAWRGRAIAARRGAGLVHIEDAFLRSILPGRARGRLARRGPVGLIVDPVGLHFDATRPSLIETLVSSGRAAGFEAEARQAMARLVAADLSKYNAHLPDTPAPPPDYVLVIDQTAGDAALMGAGRAGFLHMLDSARAEHPGAQIVIRSHPETASGLRPGHFSHADLRPGEVFCDAPVSPWRLLAQARTVYAMSSQLGYEAMLAGHRPRVFGQPFYAGWGLSEDEQPVPRRGQASIETLFAASYLLAPVWYDPCADRLTDFEGALRQIEAEAKAWWQDHRGHVAHGMRLWKRRHVSQFFGQAAPVRFRARGSAPTLAWAGKAEEIAGFEGLRIEDGFLRSRGLGAALVPPLSLVADDVGIYYDPTRPSRFEALMAAPLPPGGAARAAALRQALIAARLTKYSLGGGRALPPRDGRRRILVPGQVEDDASIRLGAGAARSNLDLLKRVRRENPEAMLIYKPHPDVEAGLRRGSVPEAELNRLADHVATQADPLALLADVDEVWTITSTLGFEALLRGVPVTTLGAPFYAGWGLTRDLGPVPARRQSRPGLDTLTHAALIAYPRYFDPVGRLPCPPEIAVLRLSGAAPVAQRPALRLLAKLQGALAGHDWIWRR